MTFSPDAVGAALDRYPGRRCCVAYSGGLDSTVLLHALAALRDERILELRAVHVDHGLHPDSPSWAEHCIREAAALSVPCVVVRVAVDRDAGLGPEAAARDARYAALAAEVGAGEAVLTAQHADDQVETMLLALSRGAGLPGLAAMPAQFERHGMRFERPLLGVSGRALRAWLAAQDVPFVEDPTNADVAFTRSRIRHQLLPSHEADCPDFPDTFARAAQHAAQAQELLDANAA